MNSKRIVLIVALILFLFSMGCAFSDPAASKSFNLKHVVNVAREYHFEFRNPDNNDVIDSVSLTSSGTHLIATLAINYNTNITFSRIAVSFTDLKKTDNDSLYYPFTMDILRPNTSDRLVNTTSTENGHGAGAATLYENKTFRKYSTDAWNTDEVADFRINLDDSEALAGTYQGNLQIEFAVV
jgi:hypothetical protein